MIFGTDRDGISVPRSIPRWGGMPDLGAMVGQSPMVTMYVDAPCGRG
jgi:hypothetical protein